MSETIKYLKNDDFSIKDLTESAANYIKGFAN